MEVLESGMNNERKSEWQSEVIGTKTQLENVKENWMEIETESEGKSREIATKIERATRIDSKTKAQSAKWNRIGI